MNERLKTVKYINDPVYGSIPITQIELELINLPIFQRLRGLRQLGRVNYVFPGAEHSRFVHSLGVLYIMGLMADHLFRHELLEEDDVVKMRVAALLHDIGHYPLSHVGETAYGYCLNNKTADGILEPAQNGQSDKKPELYDLVSSHNAGDAHHELLGKYIVTHNKDIKNVLNKYGLDPNEIAEIFTGQIGSKNMVYSQLLHSSLDADRLDYLLRDSYQTGVKYGLIDLQYLIRLLYVAEGSGELNNNKVLVCNKKGQHVVEHFLMSRYFHYSQVIHHKTNGSFEGLVRAMYIKLLRGKGFMYNSFDEICDDINNDEFIMFNDASLEIAFREFYNITDDDEYKILYNMYIKRKRPKIVFEIKGLYENEEDNNNKKFKNLSDKLKSEPSIFSNIIGSNLWGYQQSSISIEKIKVNEKEKLRPELVEELREAVKLYDKETKEISYLALDDLSVIGHLSNLKSSFIRIFVFDENDKLDHQKITHEISDLLN